MDSAYLVKHVIWSHACSPSYPYLVTHERLLPVVTCYSSDHKVNSNDLNAVKIKLEMIVYFLFDIVKGPFFLNSW